MQLLKDSINWLCFVKECTQKRCSIHQFFEGLSKAYDEAPWLDKIDVFIEYIKQNKDDFKFIDNFFERGQWDDLELLF